MTMLIGILAFLVAVLSILQGWSLLKIKKNNPYNLTDKLDIIITQLSRMEQRLNDIWESKK